MIAVDANFLPLLLSHTTKTPNDPRTGQPITHLEDRVNLLIETLEKDRETILVPTPVLSEFLVLADKEGQHYLSKLSKSALYRIAPFDTMAAVELSAIRLKKLASLSKTARNRETPQETKAKISFDRQIVAIAKVNKVHTLYSDDDGVRRFAEENCIKVVCTWELPAPPPALQMNLEEFFKVNAQREDASTEAIAKGELPVEASRERKVSESPSTDLNLPPATID